MAVASVQGLSRRGAGLEAGVLMIALMNGFAPRVIHAVLEQGWAGALTAAGNINLLEAIIAALACRQVARAAPAPSAHPVVWLTAGAALIPHGGLVWSALALVALWRCVTTNDETLRIGYGLTLALCAHELWIGVLFAPASASILVIETRLTALALEIMGRSAMAFGNMLTVPGGHTLVVLSACSIAPALSLGWVTVWAAATSPGGLVLRRALIAGAALTVALVAGNTLRLALMAWDIDLYAVVHGQNGAAVTEAIATALTVAAALIARSPKGGT